MVKTVLRFTRTLLFSLFAVVGGGIMAVSFVSATAPSAAAFDCENDGCMRACVDGECGGECFDNPDSGKGCAMSGGDCGAYMCQPS